MARHIKREDDDIGPSRGLAKWFHKFMMLLLFPLRKPVWFALIAAVLFLAPTFRGIKPAEVHLWYWNHIKNLTSRAGSQISDKTRQVRPAMEKVGEIVETIAPGTVTGGNAENALIPAPREPVLVNQPPREVRRKVFEKAKDTAPVSVEKTLAAAPAQVSRPAAVKTASVQAEKNKTPAKLNLRYLNVPEEISGVPQVINVNEMKVAGQAVFLYGIFAQPTSDKGISGEIYLRRLVEGKNVNCVIGAYTFQNVATAICTVDGININRSLVDRGYSKNVALD